VRTLIAVIGSSQAPKRVLDAAYEVGAEVIRAGFTLICGGLGGVMEAACRGASACTGNQVGRIIGILPGTDKHEANPYVDTALATGLGYARNVIIACAADAVIAVSGGSGTLSEIALAWQYGKPIVVLDVLPGIASELAGKPLDNRRSDRIEAAKNPREAVETVKLLLEKKINRT